MARDYRYNEADYHELRDDFYGQITDEDYDRLYEYIPFNMDEESNKYWPPEVEPDYSMCINVLPWYAAIWYYGIRKYSQFWLEKYCVRHIAYYCVEHKNKKAPWYHEIPFKIASKLEFWIRNWMRPRKAE